MRAFLSNSFDFFSENYIFLWSAVFVISPGSMCVEGWKFSLRWVRKGETELKTCKLSTTLIFTFANNPSREFGRQRKLVLEKERSLMCRAQNVHVIGLNRLIAHWGVYIMNQEM